MYLEQVPSPGAGLVFSPPPGGLEYAFREAPDAAGGLTLAALAYVHDDEPGEKTVCEHPLAQRLIEELRGNSCYPLDTNPAQKKNITVSRTFGRAIRTFDELAEAITTYATRGAEKLRKNGLVADVISVFIMTSRFDSETFYHNTEIIRLPASSSNSTEIIAAAIQGLRKIYRQGCLYKKAGLFFQEQFQPGPNDGFVVQQ